MDPKNTQQNTPKPPAPPAPLPPNEGQRLENIVGFIETVSAAPTGVPKTFWDSIKNYSNGGTYRLYVYVQGVGWKYTALT